MLRAPFYALQTAMLARMVAAMFLLSRVCFCDPQTRKLNLPSESNSNCDRSAEHCSAGFGG